MTAIGSLITKRKSDSSGLGTGNAITGKPRSRYERVVVVSRKTELEELTARFNTVAQVKFYLERAGRDFDIIYQAHEQYHAILSGVRRLIPASQKSMLIDRAMLTQYAFGDDDLVIAVGQDGLVVNAAKYLRCQPIIGVNPDPKQIEGVLLGYDLARLSRQLADTLSGHARIQEVTMAKASTNDGQELMAFNDLFVGPRSHVSARYRIEQGGYGENQSSSGIIISTGAGSTGWMKSIVAGAVGVINAIGGDVHFPDDQAKFAWDADHLLFAVREPWPSKTSSSALVFGIITPEKPLLIHSNMAEHGTIFSDGMEQDFLKFNAGHSVEIAIADHKARLIV